MRKLSTGLISLQLPLTQHWARALLPGIAEEVRLHSDVSLIHQPSPDHLPQTLGIQEKPVGLIGALEASTEKTLRTLNIPLVNISGNVAFSRYPTVTHDNWLVGKMAAEHLLEKGYQHFAYIGIGDEPLTLERWRGFHDRLQEEQVEAFRFDRGDISAGKMKGWIEKLPCPLGVFGVHDNIARKICWEAERIGLSIPKEMGVVGVDNDEVCCELSRIPLSSIQLDFDLLGRVAAQRLLAELHGESGLEWKTLIPPLGVVERLSTDLLAVEDSLVRRARDIMKVRREGRLGVADLARELGVSKSSLEKRFKSATGRTVFSVIHQTRMENARDLILNSHLSVAEVSYAIGLADTKRFTTLFKEAYGDTPRGIRSARTRGRLEP
jgi:LacI family transcriptional regulator